MFAAPDDYKGRTHLVRHKIKTNSDIPIRKNPYRVSLREREIINNQIDKMLKKGIISHSSSPWASPVILVKKKDGTFRFCVDYRNLNSITVKDQYPLPRIDDCFDSLHGSRYFTSLDLCSGYWQVEVEEQDREKTAFVTPDGLYHFNVLPFGLCNGPATFERLMDNILRTHKWKICLCYLDDVIVFSEDLPSHLTRLKTILGCLRKAGLTLNLSKCRFAYEELLLLGHVVSKEGITPDPEKIASIKDFPALKTIKNVRAFLGLCSYYRRFIKEFSKIAYPLQILTQKLSSPEVLTHYDPNKPIGLHTDASDQGLGAVLIHVEDNGRERPISYASRTLQKAETNYSTTEKECLAIIWAIGKFRPYLYGRKFIVYTDHHSLCWMAKAKKLSGRLARWSLELQAYDFTINYKSGKTHLDADGLSRCPIPDNIKILQINYNTEDYDAYIKKINNMIDQHPNSYGENFTKHNGKIYKNNPTPTGNPWLLVIPKTKQLELLEQMHDHPTSGHMGIKRTYSRIKDKYFWPSMFKTVEKYVSSCPECQFRKTPSQQPSGQLQPIPPASRPFERIGIDLLGRFPKSINGNRWIVVCTDYYSRHVETAALPRGTATEIADFFLKKIVLRHGAPKILISDRGSSFLSKLLTQVLKICNTIHKKTTSYHPQTNGQTERMNRTLTDMISMYIDEKHQNWDEILPFVTFAYNSSVQETTGYSPYFLIHGREPLTFLDSTFDWPEVPPKPGDFDDYISNLLTIVEESKKISMARTMARQDKSKQVYDKHRREVNFSPEDLVLIWTPIRKVGRADKLQKNYIGPFKIIRKTSPVNYEVKEVTGRGKKIRAPPFSHLASDEMSIDMPNSASPRSTGSAGQMPGRPSILSQSGEKNSPKNGIHREISKENSTNEDYANSPAGVKNATSNDAAQVLRNWTDCAEDLNPGTDDRRQGQEEAPRIGGFTCIGSAIQRRWNISPTATVVAMDAPGPRDHVHEGTRHGGQGSPGVLQRGAVRLPGVLPGLPECCPIRQGKWALPGGTRQQIPGGTPDPGGPRDRRNPHQDLPFRKSSKRITVGNLPFFVGDAAIVDALSRYGRITSIAPKLLKAGEFTYTDGRREAFILLHDGITIDKLPTRFEIRIKGEAWPAFLSHGIKCSKCHGQGHRRANCPQLHGHSTTSRRASPLSIPNLLPSTAPGLPRQSSAAPPAPAPPSPAVGLSGAPPDARAASLPSTAPLPSTPAPPASSVQVATPAPPPMAPAPEDPASPRSAATELTPPARPDFVAPCGPLPAQGTLGPATHTPDVVMTTIEETSASSPAAVIPTPPLPAPQPAGPTPPAPHEEETTPTVKTPSPLLLEQEENMIVEIFRKLNHTTCLKPLYESGMHPNELKSDILFTDDRMSLMARLSPALKGVLAEFLGAAIELAQNYHPIVGLDMAKLRRRCLNS
ncbi:hypothetical protein LAZ67_20000415 [Cordylochernes scorpioides]|uniref:RNA-directed DNA polymerase n=1 Tax=Cordylochernes scorpioides TaxID=51811 RepID=A0ABY6LLF9_9ARAC|nr:hypothetical protein LAZ67_20000415 [Cordylochernes scorpioides]